jgi:thiol-disulfide isomerase/thioredoxin
MNRMKAKIFGAALAGLLLVLPAASAQSFPDLDLEGRDGSSVKISQLRGNVVFVNLWATWCGPCRMELPLLQDLYNKYSDRNFVVLTVNVDSDRSRVGPFLKAHNLTLPVYFADPYAVAMLTSRGIPTSFILTPDGSIEKMFIGFDPNIEKDWIAHIDKYLKKKRAVKS